MNGEVIFVWCLLALLVFGLVFGVGGVIISEVNAHKERKRRKK